VPQRGKRSHYTGTAAYIPRVSFPVLKKALHLVWLSAFALDVIPLGPSLMLNEPLMIIGAFHSYSRLRICNEH